MFNRLIAPGLALAIFTGPAWAGNADVVDVMAKRDGADTWRIDVTVKHADEGWDHFADRLDVVGPEGNIIATRVLAHPHVDEQLFTRSLNKVKIPKGIGKITLRAHDKVHGNGGAEMTIELDR